MHDVVTVYIRSEGICVQENPVKEFDGAAFRPASRVFLGFVECVVFCSGGILYIWLKHAR